MKRVDLYVVARPETEARLKTLVAMLTKWQRAQNLVSPSTLKDAWKRHVVDSAQLLRHVPAAAETLLDIGSGAGFPGLVLALLLEDRGVAVTLVEANGRKTAFLRAVAREVSIDADIIQARIEDYRPTRAPDVITARAVAPLTRLCDWIEPLWSSDTLAILPKGADWQKEVEDARETWHFKLATRPSVTADGATILLMRDLEKGPGSRLPGSS